MPRSKKRTLANKKIPQMIARFALLVLLIFFALLLLFGIVGLFVPQTHSYISYITELAKRGVASVFFRESKSVSDLIEKYKRAEERNSKVKVLIVPGHEPHFGGTEHNGIYERVVVSDIAENLKKFIMQNPNFDVNISRDNTDWNKDLKNFFNEKWNDISKWRNAQKQEMSVLIRNGEMMRYAGPYHNSAPEDVAIRLYGINKWANENNYDIVIHLHLNDYPRGTYGSGGRYSGFSIYIPEKQYSNSNSSRAVAQKIFDRLSSKSAVSNLPTEKNGIVEDQDLIAIGAANTLDGASVLIEFGYIYEPQFQSEKVRKVLAKELAYQTYAGIDEFFGFQKCSANDFGTTLLPYIFNENIEAEEKSENVLRLQYALQFLGNYPPKGESIRGCPFTGYFGDCTKSALIEFQEERLSSEDFKKEKGKFGEKTKKQLNLIFSPELALI